MSRVGGVDRAARVGEGGALCEERVDGGRKDHESECSKKRRFHRIRGRRSMRCARVASGKSSATQDGPMHRPWLWLWLLLTTQRVDREYVWEVPDRTVHKYRRTNKTKMAMRCETRGGSC